MADSELESSTTNASYYDQGEVTSCSNHDGITYDVRYAPDDFITSQFFYSPPERYFILTFFPLLLTLGLIGNVAFLVVVAKVTGMRTITNAYLVNLAVCDIMFIFLSLNDVLISFLVSPRVRSKRYSSSFDCGLAHAFIYGTHFTADCLIVFMSFERYLAICKPLKHRLMSSEGRTLKFIIFSWVAGFAYTGLVIPRFAFLEKVCVLWPDRERYAPLPTYLKSCQEVQPVFYWFSNMAMACPYTLAFGLNSILYCKIIKKMHSRIRKVGDAPNQETEGAEPIVEVNQAHNARNKVARLLITTGTSYFLCFLPYISMQLNYAILGVTNYRVGLDLTEKTFWQAFWVCVGLGTLNSVVNPLIYSVTNSRYRNAFKQVFSCKIIR